VTPCVVCTMHVETSKVGFLVEPQNQGQRFVGGLTSKPLRRFLPVWPQNRWPEFPGLSLKIGSSNLLIYPSKSPRQFLGLDIKTKRALVYRLRHKIDGGRTTRDMRRDLVACFNMKQVWLGFLSLASRLVEARRRMMHVVSSRRSRGVKTEDRRVDATGYVEPFCPKIVVFYVLGPMSNLVF
jgi:hypothetical protein